MDFFLNNWFKESNNMMVKKNLRETKLLWIVMSSNYDGRKISLVCFLGMYESSSHFSRKEDYCER